MVKSRSQSYFVPKQVLKLRLWHWVKSIKKVCNIHQMWKVVMSWIRQRPTRTNLWRVLIKATLTLEYLFVKKCFDKRILYVKESVGVLMVLKGFKNKSNKPYRSSLAHELRFTTYRDDIILVLCQSNRVNYACEFYEFSFWTHKRQSTLINERYIDRKEWAA